MRVAPLSSTPTTSGPTSSPLRTRTFWFALGLRPYGGNLAAPDANRWIAFATVLISLLAGVDASVWAYVFASLATTQLAQGLIAVLTWVIIFRVITMFDAWMVTLDRSRGVYDSKPRTFRDELKYYVMFSMRVASVGIVFLAAGPFLPELLFTRTVTGTLTRTNAERRAAALAVIESRWTAVVTSLRERETHLLDEQRLELSGQSASRKYGEGPVSRENARQLKLVHDEIAVAERSRNAELRTFQNATPEELEATYGVKFEINEAGTRKRLLRQLMASDDTYSVYMRVINGILLLMLIILLVAKLAEPDSIRMYYSAALQDYYQQYRAGKFDQMLDLTDRYSSDGGMTPFRFEAWIRNTYLTAADRDALRAKHGALVEASHIRINSLSIIERDLQNESSPLRAELTQHEIATEAARSRLAVAQREYSITRAVADDLLQQCNDLEGSRAELRGPARTEALRILANVSKEARAARLNVESKLEERNNLQMAFESCEVAQQRVRAALRLKEASIERVRTEIAAARDVLINAIRRDVESDAEAGSRATGGLHAV